MNRRHLCLLETPSRIRKAAARSSLVKFVVLLLNLPDEVCRGVPTLDCRAGQCRCNGESGEFVPRTPSTFHRVYTPVSH